jgi:Phage integrase, N-terminal SAM-like domain
MLQLQMAQTRTSLIHTPVPGDVPSIEPSTSVAHPPRLLDRVRAAVRARHYSRRTEKAYVGWIRRFIVFHGRRHPCEMRAPEITQYLSSLATAGQVAASSSPGT